MTDFDAIAFRHDLHRNPEVSGHEEQTAATIAGALRGLGIDDVLTGIGGHGVIGIIDGQAPGPTLLFRCELDALPILETPRPHRSARPGVAHLCGHDGHMTILIALAHRLIDRRPATGRVVLLFQPAEETGAGGPACAADPGLAALRPDMALALHNMPGLPLGHVGLATGPIASASRGMQLEFHGATSHASEPEKAHSPRAALAHLMTALPALGSSDPFRLVSLSHVALGTPSFGITAGDGTLMATLRTRTDDGMADLVAEAEALARDAITDQRISLDISYHEIFAHTENHPAAAEALRAACEAEGIPCGPDGGTMTPSEDFGALGRLAPSAMLFLGAGVDHPALHTPDYDFPDALIATGARLFERVVRQRLG